MHLYIERFVLLIVCSTFFVSVSAAQAADVIDYSGEYAMQGKGFGVQDSAYTGTCSVQRADHGYRVSCFNRDTRHTYVGKGLAHGDTLAVLIGDMLQGDHDAIYAGEYLVLYQRRPDGNLTGTWVHAKSQFAGTETLTRKK